MGTGSVDHQRPQLGWQKFPTGSASLQPTTQRRRQLVAGKALEPHGLAGSGTASRTRPRDDHVPAFALVQAFGEGQAREPVRFKTLEPGKLPTGQ